MLLQHCAFLLAMVLSAASHADELRSVQDIIQQEGQFIFVDGSSYFRLDSNGAFASGPMGTSGRTINGTWHTSPGSSTFEITGTLGWLNGISESEASTIKLVIVIYLLDDAEKDISALWAPHGDQPLRVYKPYFIIQQLTAIASAGNR